MSINSRQPVPFSKTPFKIRKKIYTSREDWMGRCPKKLQGGSRKSAVQKVLILPLRSSRRRRARPSLRSRRSQNRSRRRMPPPSSKAASPPSGFEGALPCNSFTLHLTRGDRNLYSLDLAFT